MFKFISIFIVVSAIFIAYAFINNQEPETAKILYVVDGDTFRVDINGKQEYVRLIGINAPELSECFGQTAKQDLQLLNGQIITLKADSSQSDRDKYGRLLRYAFVNEKNINYFLVAQGYAREYTYSKPYQYQKDFLNAQAQAQENGKGLWSCK